jgi:hypothetical protein
MTPDKSTPYEERLLASYRRRRLRDRAYTLTGLSLLLAGYAVLAINPETPLDWVLLRVAAGFTLLFFGFGLAIVPWLSRVSGGED